VIICKFANVQSEEQRRFLDMAKLEVFTGFYSQVVPNWDRKNIEEKIVI
jgi:hypothetical protein